MENQKNLRAELTLEDTDPELAKFMNEKLRLRPKLGEVGEGTWNEIMDAYGERYRRACLSGATKLELQMLAAWPLARLLEAARNNVGESPELTLAKVMAEGLMEGAEGTAAGLKRSEAARLHVGFLQEIEPSGGDSEQIKQKKTEIRDRMKLDFEKGGGLENSLDEIAELKASTIKARQAERLESSTVESDPVAAGEDTPRPFDEIALKTNFQDWGVPSAVQDTILIAYRLGLDRVVRDPSKTVYTEDLVRIQAEYDRKPPGPRQLRNHISEYRQILKENSPAPTGA